MKRTMLWMFSLVGFSLLAATSMMGANSPSTPSDGATPEHHRRALMLAKLASTQRIVEGLVVKDFLAIRRGAEELMQVCDASQWTTNADPAYSHYRTELRRQAVKLTRMADEQNLDGAAFCYMSSMSTCISCHQYCRDILHIASDPRSASKVVPIPVFEEEVSNAERRNFRR